MNVVFAFERVRIPFIVVDALNLDRRVEQVVLAAQQVRHLGQCLERLDRLDVARHGVFALRDGPHVQIVHIDHIVAALVVDVLFQLLHIDVAGGALHHDHDDVLDDGDRREEDNEREEVGADGVRVPHRREEVDYDGCDDHTDAHQHVTQDVQVGSIYIDVAHWLLVIVVMVVMVFVLVVVFGLMPLFIVQQVPFDLFIRDLPHGTLIAMAVSMIVSMSMSMSMTTVLMSVMPMIVLSSQMIVSFA